MNISPINAYQKDHASQMLRSYQIHQELAEIDGIYFRASTAIQNLGYYANSAHMNKSSKVLRELQDLRDAIKLQILNKSK
jgi:hypothetical protein